jgi:phosphatidylglycerol lysyltransferase
METSRPSSIPYVGPYDRDTSRRRGRVQEVPARVAELVQRFGGPVSTAMFDPVYRRFEWPGIEGAIAYREAFGCVVVPGDPVCAPEDAVPLARRLCDAARESGRVTVFAATSESFAEAISRHGASAIAFGSEIQFDPRLDAMRGASGRELRKKISHAHRAGIVVGEYARDAFPSARVENELDRVAEAWLENRHGVQVFLTGVRLFEAPTVTRWFHARVDERYVGVLTTLRLDARDGYLFHHSLRTPDAPDGTSEALIVGALHALADEGCTFATFGPVPNRALGAMLNVSPRGEWFARRAYATCSEAFGLAARAHYDRKFQPTRESPSYLVFDPPRVGIRQHGGLLRAFNVSFA